MISIEQAKAEGFEIDNHAPGRPLAYKGPRFAPTETKPCYTELESKLLYALGQYVETNTEYATLLKELV